MKHNQHLKGFYAALENARCHFESAELMGQKKKYGLANALLIICAEEAIKAFAIISYSNKSIENKGSYEQYFSDHKIKLDTIRMIIGIHKVYNGLNDLILKSFKEQLNKNGSNASEAKNKAISEGILWMNGKSQSKRSIDEEMKWWQHATTLKENGLYVNYQQGWHSPSSVTFKSFQKTHENVEFVLNFVSGLTEEDLIKIQSKYNLKR